MLGRAIRRQEVSGLGRVIFQERPDGQVLLESLDQPGVGATGRQAGDPLLEPAQRRLEGGYVGRLVPTGRGLDTKFRQPFNPTGRVQHLAGQWLDFAAQRGHLLAHPAQEGRALAGSVLGAGLEPPGQLVEYGRLLCLGDNFFQRPLDLRGLLRPLGEVLDPHEHLAGRLSRPGPRLLFAQSGHALQALSQDTPLQAGFHPVQLRLDAGILRVRMPDRLLDAPHCLQRIGAAFGPKG